MDALSELLRTVKLSGAMFFHARGTAPWCVRTPPSAIFSRFVAEPSNHIIEFHLVVEGRGYVRVGGETTPFAAGDLVMLPHGDAHMIGNGLGAELADVTDTLPALLRGEISESRFGGGGEATRFVCGYLACEARLVRPLIACLPRVLRVSVRADPAGAWLENMLAHAVGLAQAASPGSEVVAGRLAEALFAEALRRYVLQLPPGRTGWLAAAADPAVGRALALLHQDPARDWSLDALAQEAGLSRSALTERFARYLGQSPMAYLADWRLELAAEALRTTSRAVQQIAAEVGYESEAAFNRAFKRRFDAPPARYRKTWRAERSSALSPGA